MTSIKEELLTDLAPTYMAADKTWMTRLSKVKITGTGSLTVDLIRPGEGDARGGYLYVFKDKISADAKPIVRDYLDGRQSGTFTVDSDEIDFTSNVYWLAYGPHYTDNINLVVTSIEILFGDPLVPKASVCRPISHEIDRVTSYYQFDSNELGFGRYNGWLIVREGENFGVGKEVGRRFIPSNSRNSGVKSVDVSTLKRGQTYNVALTVYSRVRPVAGYTFTTAN